MIRFVVFGALCIAACGPAAAHDAAAGQATFDKICSACHTKADFKALDQPKIEAKLKAFVAGKEKHKKKLKLTDLQIVDVATYLTAP